MSEAGGLVVIGAINVDLVVSGAALPRPGETVTDLLNIRNTRWSEWAKEENARVAVSVDAPRVVANLIERLRGLVTERA